MSFKLLGRVWEREASWAETLVLLALANHAQDDGSRCFPSVGRIAWMTGLHVRTVKRVVAALRESGVLQVRQGGGGRSATEYAIVLDTLPLKPAFLAKDRAKTGDTAPPGHTVTGDTQSPVVIHNRWHTVTAPVTHSHPSSDTQSPHPVMEPVINRSERAPTPVTGARENPESPTLTKGLTMIPKAEREKFIAQVKANATAKLPPPPAKPARKPYTPPGQAALAEIQRRRLQAGEIADQASEGAEGTDLEGV